MTDNLAMLATEIRHARNGLFNSIRNRKAHPTYGFTKKSILEDLAVLEGMLYAYWVIYKGEASAARLSQIRACYTFLFGESIDALRQTAGAA